jgi:hypothetical protein
LILADGWLGGLGLVRLGLRRRLPIGRDRLGLSCRCCVGRALGPVPITAVPGLLVNLVVPASEDIGGVVRRARVPARMSVIPRPWSAIPAWTGDEPEEELQREDGDDDPGDQPEGRDVAVAPAGPKHGTSTLVIARAGEPSARHDR